VFELELKNALEFGFFFLELLEGLTPIAVSFTFLTKYSL
jgi:hypothetical protein